MDYQRFLSSKRVATPQTGFDIAPSDINPKLFPFQRDITRWALRLGKAALFEECGLGKTPQQLEYAHQVSQHTGGQVLILAPLAVADQTVREGQKFGIDVKQVQSQSEVDNSPVVISNYDRAHLFDADKFIGIVLDESSVLKHYSKTFFALTEKFAQTPFKLCCTATPAPNDWVELGNHSLFLGIMHFKDMLARWFVGEGDIARSARLKGHAATDFWRWMTSWGVCISKPADLGDEYDMPGYDLPPMNVREYRLSAPQASIERAWANGQLLPDTSPSATTFMRAKRDSLTGRVKQVLEIVEGIPESEPVVLWCDTDFEADALMEMLNLAVTDDFVEVRGSQTAKQKEEKLRAFSNGDVRFIITKPEIGGYGLNWQHCAEMIFAGVSFSFERTYQALKRIHRYGQERPVNIHLVYAETEGNVMELLKEKQQAFAKMQAEMNAAMREHGLFREESNRTVYATAASNRAEGQDWEYYLGDCVETMPGLPDGCVDLTVTSIPFSNLYIYSDSDADVGNAKDKAEFFEHMAYVIRENYRVTKPGRCCAVHVKDLPLFQNRDGVMGIDPFSDDVVAAYRDLRECPSCGWLGFAKVDGNNCKNCNSSTKPGWVLQSRITIEKDPVIEMQKTNSHGLLFKNWRERAEILRTGLPDYLLVFQKPGDDPERRVTHDPADLTYYGDNPPAAYRIPTLPSRKNGAINAALPVWQNYANPNWNDVVVPLVWTDIDMTDVLNYIVAKSDQDERHIAPLQLDLIARVIHWKSNPGDVVFDPFGGLGSTVNQAIRMGRKGIGVELKREYWEWAVKYLQETEAEINQPTLFDFLPVEAR